MFIARNSHDDRTGNEISGGHSGHTRTSGRKQGMLLAAVTATATGLVLAVPPSAPARAVPLSAPAQAAVNPMAVNPTGLDSMSPQSLRLDAGTLAQVRAYDRYREREAAQRAKAKKALGFARKQIGKPYRWGAEGPDSYDCSGLTMAAWRKADVKIPRVTYDQYREVKRKVKLKNLEPGDLIFFHGRGHVGIYAGHGRFLHSPHTGARVRIDELSAWRKSQFAGAVRPGAPAYKKWSPSVKELARETGRKGVRETALRKPPDDQRTPQSPPAADALPAATGTPRMTAPRYTPAQQDAPPGRPASKPNTRPWAEYTAL
ncbi:C40 family peptidase [Actinomadura formosensis]|uniref:C40 family peptidase n=1 Tax=Actinomadura formosensis TaxID=60706 RepID=UPI00082B2FE8|nr:C40 family peptidase [Actinomadura formosensis]